MGAITQIPDEFVYRYDFETVQVTACGENGVRVRAAFGRAICGSFGAIQNAPAAAVSVSIGEDGASLKNGSLEVKITPYGVLSFWKDGKLILKEFMRSFVTWDEEYRSPLRVLAREYRPLPGGKHKITVRFEPCAADERIYGMGQYQHRFLDLKGMEVELAQRNTQASVPFYTSSLGYGFLWNNAATGSVFFGKEKTTWTADVSDGIDYWICTGDSYKQLLTRYCSVTGFPSPLPDYALGFWQSKLRYVSEEEVLSVARGYKERGLPLSVIVIDFFHWLHQGDWSFDPAFWEQPAEMLKELEAMGVRAAVSVWPTVENASVHYEEMKEKGYLMNTACGKRLGLDVVADTTFVDLTNPDACSYFWNCVKKGYYDSGFRTFWLDVAEPEYAYVNFENFLYAGGSAAEIGNSYPLLYAKTFYENMRKEGQTEILNLVRCAWAGSQRYGALVWSGDVNSSFRAMRNQLQAGLNMGMAGIPWWTTDIGGFHGGDVRDESFVELLIRWFEWGTFCPVMRLHGDRAPRKESVRGSFASGADNEVWSYGEEAYRIFANYLALREKLRPYLEDCAREAEQYGYPMMRTLFFEFPQDGEAYLYEDEYLLGGELLVSPVCEADCKKKRVYLPKGVLWQDVWSKKQYEGGKTVTVPTPIDRIPLFVKVGSEVSKVF